MQFCSECHNMYYLKIQDEDGKIGNTLIYYCRNCGHEDTTLSTSNICVSDIQLRTSEKKYTHIVSEYTKFDPTLPRINTIKCPNQDCISNGMAGGGGKKTTEPATVDSKKKITMKKTKATEGAQTKAAEGAQTKAEAAQTKAAAQESLAKASIEAIIAEEDALVEAENEKKGETKNREVIYIRYDDINMKYVYLCAHCDTTWRTDNRL